MPVKKLTPAQKRESLLTRLWALLEKEITNFEETGVVKSFTTLVTVMDKLSELQKEEAKQPIFKEEDLDIVRRAIIKRLEKFNAPQNLETPALLPQKP